MHLLCTIFIQYLTYSVYCCFRFPLTQKPHTNSRTHKRTSLEAPFDHFWNREQQLVAIRKGPGLGGPDNSSRGWGRVQTVSLGATAPGGWQGTLIGEECNPAIVKQEVMA